MMYIIVIGTFPIRFSRNPPDCTYQKTRVTGGQADITVGCVQVQPIITLTSIFLTLSLSHTHTTPVATLYMYYMGLIRYSKTHSQNGAIFQFVGLHGSLLAVPSVSQIGEM